MCLVTQMMHWLHISYNPQNNENIDSKEKNDVQYHINRDSEK